MVSLKKDMSYSPFGAGNDSRQNACIGKNGGPYFYADYAEAYFEGAEKLAEAILSGAALIDRVVYPMMFCYRQGVELSLKNLIRSEKEDPTKSHNLIHLHNSFLEVERKLKHRLSKENLSILNTIVSDFNKIDPSGEAFRFPENKQGELLLQNFAHLNIGSAVTRLKKIRISLGQLFWENF